MSLETGATVVHPHHGVGVVVGRHSRRSAGQERQYVEIDLEHGRMRLLIPEDAAGRIGIRPVIDDEMLSRVFDVLDEEPGVLPDAWGARSKSYQQRLATGDVLEVAALVRDLEVRSRRRNGLATVERDLLDTCRRQLVSELAVAMHVTPAHADARLQSLIAPVDAVSHDTMAPSGVDDAELTAAHERRRSNDTPSTVP